MRRGVHFDASGRSYCLRFGVNALCALEEATGRPIGEAAKRLDIKAQSGIKISDLRLFWWAALTDEKVSRDAAGDLMDEVGFEKAGQLIGEAFALAFPEVADAGKKRKATAA